MNRQGLLAPVLFHFGCEGDREGFEGHHLQFGATIGAREDFVLEHALFPCHGCVTFGARGGGLSAV